MHSTIPEPADSAGESTNQETPGARQRSVASIEYGTTGQLFDQIRDFLAQHPGLTTDAVLKLTYFIFAILFPECADIWPLASVVAPDPAGSSLLLRMIARACLGPMQIGEVTLSNLLTLPPLPRPTLLIIDQLSPNKELERVLRIMSRPGSRILRNGTLSDVSFPTLVCTAEPLRDRWILDQAIQVVLTPTRGPLPKFDSQSLDDSTRKLQRKLARYRDLNLEKVRGSRFDAAHFSSPMRQVASMLGNSIVDDPSLQRCVPMVLEAQDQDARIRRTDSTDAVVAEAALFLSHEGARRQARVGEIATLANGILKGRGESLGLDPREVGNHLRALGLFSQRLGRAGRGIRFTNEIRRNIHRLAQAYDVRSDLDNASCEFCAEARTGSGGTSDRGK
jgi:hypothetical protein